MEQDSGWSLPWTRTFASSGASSPLPRRCTAQPALSRQIQRLEEQLGVALFARTSRSVELTDAGRELVSEGKALLASAEAARRRVRRAAEGVRVLTVEFFTGDPVTPAVRAFGAAHPEVVVDVVRVYWFDQTEVLFERPG